MEILSKSQLRLFLLGSFRVERDGQLFQLPTRKVEALLAYLALHPETHAREKLAGLFWGDSTDAQARHSLAVALNALRKQLDTDLLISNRETVQLNPDYSLWVDANEISDFRFQISDLEPIAPSKSEMDLYRGDLLADFYDDWITPVRERLRLQYLDHLLQVTSEMRSRSEYERAIALAHKAIAIDATNERAHQHLIFCYLATGRRADAVKQYEACRHTLLEELGVEPQPDTLALYEWLRETPPEIGSSAARLTNLPIPLTRLIGRERESAKVKQLLIVHRLMTLTGAGGSGKTRLAIQVATEMLDAFKDGVWWVELVAVMDDALVPQMVAKTLGVHEVPNAPLVETLAEHLSTKHLLLVLDNCEHLMTACARLAERMLSACPHLKVLVTSRESLSITGEQVWLVPTLSFPTTSDLHGPSIAHDKPPVPYLQQYESIQLFTERATAVQSDFELTEHTAPAVAQICRRLDGIPLAIELAAARAKTLSAPEIAAHLDDRFNLLTMGSRTVVPRHQTLRATLNWSYDLLTDDERKLFTRLSVFAGNFGLDAVEAICAQELVSFSVLNLSARLVDKSLVVVAQSEGATRYRLLETLRDYAREKLIASGELEIVCERHLDYFLKLAEEVEPKLYTAESEEGAARLERVHDNLRAALAWSLEHERPEASLRLTGALAEFWKLRGYWNEGRRWLERAVAASETKTPLFWEARAKALLGAAAIVWGQGDYPRAEALGEEGLLLYQQLEDELGMAQAYRLVGLSARAQRSYKRAVQCLENSLRLYREVEDQWHIAEVLGHLGTVAWRLGQYARAKAMLEESLKLSRATLNHQAEAGVLDQLACITYDAGDYALALPLLDESLTLFRQLNNKSGMSEVYGDLADVMRRQGNYEQAQAFVDESLRLRRDLGAKRAIGRALITRGDVAWALGDVAHARDCYEQCEAIFRELADRLDVARTLWRLGHVAAFEGDHAERPHLREAARNLYQDSLTILREIGSPVEIANALVGLGDLARRQGEYAQAQEHYAECLTIRRELVNRQDIAEALERFAHLAVSLEQAERAARLFAAAHTLRQDMNVSIPPIEQEEHERHVDAARAKLGDDAFAAAWAEGQALTCEQAIAYALFI